MIENKEKLLKLQKDFENGKILEEDLDIDDADKLEELYDEQISLLKEMKAMYKKKLEIYKQETSSKLDLLKKLNKK